MLAKALQDTADGLAENGGNGGGHEGIGLRKSGGEAARMENDKREPGREEEA